MAVREDDQVGSGGRCFIRSRVLCAPGAWSYTNTSLGGAREPVVPPAVACTLAVGAAAALGADLIGVDLLPVDGGYVNPRTQPAVDFTAQYAPPGQDVTPVKAVAG